MSPQENRLVLSRMRGGKGKAGQLVNLESFWFTERAKPNQYELALTSIRENKGLTTPVKAAPRQQ